MLRQNADEYSSSIIEVRAQLRKLIGAKAQFLQASARGRAWALHVDDYAVAVFE